MKLKSEVTDPIVVPCACCWQPSTGEVWRHRVCDGCFDLWLEDSPNAGEAERLSTPAQLAASRAAGGLTSAFFEAWTAAWLKRNARSRAA